MCVCAHVSKYTAQKSQIQKDPFKVRVIACCCCCMYIYNNTWGQGGAERKDGRISCRHRCRSRRLGGNLFLAKGVIKDLLQSRCDPCRRHHRNSGGHCLRGIQRPSASKRGLRGYSNPKSFVVPIGTTYDSHHQLRCSREYKRGLTQPRPLSRTKDLFPVCTNIVEPPHVAFASDTTPLGIPLLSCAALCPVRCQRGR
jgi:hypothetical protein